MRAKPNNTWTDTATQDIADAINDGLISQAEGDQDRAQAAVDRAVKIANNPASQKRR